MFWDCTSLTSAPALPATTLAASCYSGMFCNCTSLSSVTCLATNILAENCTGIWLDNVASTGTLYRSPNVDNDFWSEKIPSGWNIVAAQ